MMEGEKRISKEKPFCSNTYLGVSKADVGFIVSSAEMRGDQQSWTPEKKQADFNIYINTKSHI